MIPVGNIPSEQLDAFSSELRKVIKGRELIVTKDISQTSNSATQLLAIYPGAATRFEVNELVETLALQNTPVAGWVFLKAESKL